MANNEKPLGIAIVICEKVITEERTNNKTLVSTFNIIGAKNFPCRHPRMAAYVTLTNAFGERDICLAMKLGEEKVFELKGRVTFNDPNHVVELIFNIHDCLFPLAGRYCFEVTSDGEFVFDTRFHVIQLPNNEDV